MYIQESIEASFLQESVNGQKTGNYFIKGVFLQADVKNRNGRYYPERTCDSAVMKYNTDFIQTGRSLGELGHPPNGGAVNLHLASHKIEELYKDGKNYIGSAKIIDTPMGNIAKSLIQEGVKLGVSLRGRAQIQSKRGMDIVGENFYMTTVDIVYDPSMPQAFVDGIMENSQTYLKNGALSEQDYQYIQESVRALPSSQLNDDTYLKILKKTLK